jgi:hypothetical protein
MTDKQLKDAAMERFPDLKDKERSKLMRAVWIQGVEFGIKQAGNRQQPRSIRIPGPLHFQ